MEEAQGPPPMSDSTKLAYERTFLAHERTQMAWLRTSLSLISFGFTIAKLFQYLHSEKGEAGPLLGARGVGGFMIVLGLAGMLLAMVQHHSALKLLRARWPEMPRSEARAMSMLLTLFGVSALISAF